MPCSGKKPISESVRPADNEAGFRQRSGQSPVEQRGKCPAVKKIAVLVETDQPGKIRSRGEKSFFLLSKTIGGAARSPLRNFPHMKSAEAERATGFTGALQISFKKLALGSSLQAADREHGNLHVNQAWTRRSE